jgi:Mg2+ and Co2+ transporter CorA
MNSEIIQSFNPSIKNVTIADAKVRVKDLIKSLDYMTYFRRQETSPDEATTISEIEAEIDFYEDQIFKEKEKEKFDVLESQMFAIQETTYQLLGGLFNPKTQGHTLDYHTNKLFQTPCVINEEASSREISYPSTRQGDANEEQIELLKQQVSKLEGTVASLTQMVQLLAREPREKLDEVDKTQQSLNYTTCYGPNDTWYEDADEDVNDEDDEDADEVDDEGKRISKCIWRYTLNRNH